MTKIQTLHILNKSPEHPRFARCLSMASPDDAILLIENGVLGLASAAISTSGQLLALAPDMAARGLDDGSTSFETIDYDGMVDLTTRAQQVVSW
ncbi:sulfurtransferase complex subunit TusB [Marinobacter pelagius]|uniref:sulfurtransferase complex subunit TusB n=1 Tax=Marinobacter sp. C7 TaxID=2951363 RepID=UPI001EEFE43D|nr:sulfurtransferase complex subunit TusB [Marinobacter sp. C7]MCG7199583.1 sulfurtransferase complex subunit TusB [Marinobacter sp. C7]